jgi:hypothetical protein
LVNAATKKGPKPSATLSSLRNVPVGRLEGELGSIAVLAQMAQNDMEKLVMHHVLQKLPGSLVAQMTMGR